MKNKINCGSIERIDIENDPRWDTFVTEHPFDWLYHLSNWKNVLDKSFKNMTGYYFALLDNRQAIRAGQPAYEVKSYLTGRRLVSIPFSTLVDPLVSDHQDFTELFTAVLDQFGSGNKTRIEFRTHHSPAAIRDDRLACSQFYKHHFLDLRWGPEDLRKNSIADASGSASPGPKKNNLQLRIGSAETDLQQYYHLHTRTRKNVGRRPPHPYRFFRSSGGISSLRRSSPCCSRKKTGYRSPASSSCTLRPGFPLNLPRTTNDIRISARTIFCFGYAKKTNGKETPGVSP